MNREYCKNCKHLTRESKDDYCSHLGMWIFYVDKGDCPVYLKEKYGTYRPLV